MKVLDESPTDELPVLTELDVVELDASPVLLPPGDDNAAGADGESECSTGRFPLPDDLPDVEPFPEPDEEFGFLRAQILVLEASLDDKDGEIASLAERLEATRQAVERRDETERQLRGQLAEAESQRSRLEERLSEAEALASRYAERVAELTSNLRTLEQAVGQRDAAFADLEAELIAREARVVERERAIAEAASRTDDEASPQPLAPEPAPPPASDLEGALARSREEAAALAAYVDCRRAHWLALEAQLEEHRERLRELEQEIEQRAERERHEAARADAEARRAEGLRAELARRRAGEDVDAYPDAAGRTAPRVPAASAVAAGDAQAADTIPSAARPDETATLRVPRPYGAPPAPDLAPALDAALVCLTSEPPREYRLDGSALLIGRGPHCDIRIATHFVSREHARVVCEGGHVLIEDLGSKNGVFVNAVRVDRGALRHGDLVTIGETQFRFEAEEAASG